MLFRSLLDLLPGVRLVSKVTVARRLGVDGLLESELLDNHSCTRVNASASVPGDEEIEGRTRAEIPVLEDDFGDVLIRVAGLSSSVRVDEDGEGLSDSDSVGELRETRSLV